MSLCCILSIMDPPHEAVDEYLLGYGNGLRSTPSPPSDSVRKHGVEEFHGTSMEESDKAEFWLEKLERTLDEVRCPMDKKATCVVSLPQGAAYDWWKLVLSLIWY